MSRAAKIELLKRCSDKIVTIAATKHKDPVIRQVAAVILDQRKQK
jgi:hypothetical protein